jgi:hypothetical protein
VAQRIIGSEWCLRLQIRSYPVFAFYFFHGKIPEVLKTTGAKHVFTPLSYGKYFPVMDRCRPASSCVCTGISPSVLSQCRVQHSSVGSVLACCTAGPSSNPCSWLQGGFSCWAKAMKRGSQNLYYKGTVSVLTVLAGTVNTLLTLKFVNCTPEYS